MQRVMCKSKIHRARVTQADLNYMGSITIDKTLMLASDIMPYEQVHVVNVTNGNRFVTYAIEGGIDSGVICVNGAAARLVAPDDIVIIISYAQYNEAEMLEFKPKVIFVDRQNKMLMDSGIEKEFTRYDDDLIVL